MSCTTFTFIENTPMNPTFTTSPDSVSIFHTFKILIFFLYTPFFYNQITFFPKKNNFPFVVIYINPDKIILFSFIKNPDRIHYHGQSHLIYPCKKIAGQTMLSHHLTCYIKWIKNGYHKLAFGNLITKCFSLFVSSAHHRFPVQPPGYHSSDYHLAR